jgi:hypothetical protein
MAHRYKNLNVTLNFKGLGTLIPERYVGWGEASLILYLVRDIKKRTAQSFQNVL